MAQWDSKKLDPEKKEHDDTYSVTELVKMAIKDKGKPFAKAFDPQRHHEVAKGNKWAMDPPDDPKEREIWEVNKARLRSTQCPDGWSIKKHMAEHPEKYDV